MIESIRRDIKILFAFSDYIVLIRWSYVGPYMARNAYVTRVGIHHNCLNVFLQFGSKCLSVYGHTFYTILNQANHYRRRRRQQQQ